MAYNKSCVLGNKYKCKQCGKQAFAFNLSDKDKVCSIMQKKHICWECAYWENFIKHPPDNLEIIGDRCYQILSFVEDLQFNQIVGGNGKTKFLLKKNGDCIKSNDIWWINRIPFQYQDKLQITGWWTTRRVYNSLQRSRHKCIAKGCLDRYHCYRYQYQIEFEKGPYNKVPLDWIIGGEHCPAFIPLREIKGYDEYVKTSDIIDESSIVSKNDKL
jgi:hypothetical protein